MLSQVHLQISYCTISLKPSDIFAQIMECLISRPEWLIDTNFNLIHQCEVSKLMYLSFISLPVTWFVTVRYTLEYFRNRWRFLAENWVNWAPNSTYYFMKFWLENIRCSLRNRAITISKRTWKDREKSPTVNLQCLKHHWHEDLSTTMLDSVVLQ